MVLVTGTAKQVVLLKLTVSWEDQMEEVFERKRAKYAGAEDVCRAFKNNGIAGPHRKRAIRNITDVTEKASRWLWMKRDNTWTIHAIWTQSGGSSTMFGLPGCD